MSSIGNSVNESAEERFTLEDLLLVEDVCYIDEIISEAPEDVDRRDQEMLALHGFSSCKVIVEPLQLPCDEAADDEGNAIDEDNLDYGEMDTSESGDERARAVSEKSATDDEKKRNFEIWKGHYEQWLAGYKIPLKHKRCDYHKGHHRERTDEPCASSSRSSEGPRKYRDEADGRRHKN
ncbi:hypothetical protein AAVH_24946 [Aphelenchoides avenae]|nr:hypothetical protein AAVH_24946 [Aphelenchus avenae]